MFLDFLFGDDSGDTDDSDDINRDLDTELLERWVKLLFLFFIFFM